MKIRLLVLTQPRGDARAIRRALRAAAIDEALIEDLLAGRATFPRELYAGEDGPQAREVLRACRSAGLECSTVEEPTRMRRSLAPAQPVVGPTAGKPDAPPAYASALSFAFAHRYALLAGVGALGLGAGAWTVLSGPGEKPRGGGLQMSEAEFMEAAKGKAGDGTMPDIEIQGGSGGAEPTEIDLGGAPTSRTGGTSGPSRHTDIMGPLAGGVGASFGIGIGYRAGRRGARGSLSQRLRVLAYVLGAVLLAAGGMAAVLASGWTPKIELISSKKAAQGARSGATAPVGGVFKRFVADQHQASACSRSLPPFAGLLCKMREMHDSQPEGLPPPSAAGAQAGNGASTGGAGEDDEAASPAATAAPAAAASPAPAAPAAAPVAASAPVALPVATPMPAPPAPVAPPPVSTPILAPPTPATSSRPAAAYTALAPPPRSPAPAAASDAAPPGSVALPRAPEPEPTVLPPTPAPEPAPAPIVPSPTPAPAPDPSPALVNAAPTPPAPTPEDPPSAQPAPDPTSGGAARQPQRTPGRGGPPPTISAPGLKLPSHPNPEPGTSNPAPYALFGLVGGLGLGMVLGLFKRGAA